MIYFFNILLFRKSYQKRKKMFVSINFIILIFLFILFVNQKVIFLLIGKSKIELLSIST